jgi:hypothetical protein
MEPSGLNSTPPDDAVLEALLRGGAEPDLPDDGFTRRVLAALPPSRPRIDLRRLILCAIGLAAGAAAGFRQVTGTPAWGAIAGQAAAFFSNPIAVAALGILVAGAIVLAGGEEFGVEL